MGITRVKSKNIDAVMHWRRATFFANGTFDPIGTGIGIVIAGSGCTQLTLSTSSGSIKDDGFLAIVLNYSAGSMIVEAEYDITLPSNKAAIFAYDGAGDIWMHLDVDVEASGGGSTYTWTLADGTTSIVVDSGETVTVADGTGVHASIVGNTLNIRGAQEWSDGSTTVEGVSHVTLSGATITETAANEITVDIAGGGGGSWTIETDSGSCVIDDGDTLEFKGANGLEVLRNAVDSVEITRDFAQNELMHPLKNGDFSRKSELNSSLPHLWEDSYWAMPGFRDTGGKLPDPVRGDYLINHFYNGAGVYCNSQVLPVQSNTPYVLSGWGFADSAKLFLTIQALTASQAPIADVASFEFGADAAFRDRPAAQQLWGAYNVLEWYYCGANRFFWTPVAADLRPWAFFFDMIRFPYLGREGIHFIKLGLWAGNPGNVNAGWCNVDMRHEIFPTGWALANLKEFPIPI